MEKVKCTEYRGIRDLVAAEVLVDTLEKFECDTPFSVAWTSELGKETESSSESHYYDNVPANVINSVGADTVSVNVSAVPMEIKAKITGQHYDESLGLFVEGEPESKYFAIGYITETTDGEEVYVWRLKGKFGIPGDTHITKDNGTSANGNTLTYTGINTVHKFTATSKSAKAVNEYKSKCPMDEAAFFASVQTHDTIKAAQATAAAAAAAASTSA